MADERCNDLKDELEARQGEESVGTMTSLLPIYEAMRSGDRERAYELMREYVQDATGRILP